jgi:hypothetical protein
MAVWTRESRPLRTGWSTTSSIVRGSVAVSVILDRAAGRLLIETSHDNAAGVHPQADEMFARIDARTRMVGGLLTTADGPPRTMLASIPVPYPTPDPAPS